MIRLNLHWLLSAACCFAASCVGTQAQAACFEPDSAQVLPTVSVSSIAPSAAVTSITPQHEVGRGQFEQLGVTSVADALLRLPSITLRDYGGAGGMKTVAVRGLDSRHTGVSIDGVMVGNSQSGEIDFARYSLDQLQGMTLSIGLSDDIFMPARQAAFPAVLALQSIQPQLDPARPSITTARLSAGSFGYVSPYLRHQQRLSQRLTLAASASATRADNQYPFELHNVSLVTNEHRQHSSMRSAQADMSLLWQLHDEQALQARAYYYDSERDLPGPVHMYTNISRETLHEREAFAQLHHEMRLSPRLRMRNSAKGTWMNSAYDDPVYHGGATSATYFQREAYVTSSFLYQLAPTLSASYAADYAFNNLNSSLTTDVRPRRHTVLQALSLRHRTERLTATAQLLGSLYWNRAKDGTGASDQQRLSPALAASYRLLPNRSLFIRASFKDIFRMPSFNENYFFHYGSPSVRPERTSQWNAGLTWDEQLSPAWHVQLTADAYLNHVRDKIVAVPRNLFVWQTINVGKVRIVGVDVTASAACRLHPHHSLQAQANYSMQHATNRTLSTSPYYGNQLAYIPRHTANAAVSWQNPWLSISCHAEGISDRYSTNEHYDGTHLSGYWEMGLTVWRDVSLGRNSLQLRADVKNLLNRQYEIVKHYPMPGRSFVVSAQYNL